MNTTYEFQVLDCDGLPVRGVQVTVNGQLAGFDGNTGLYRLKMQSSDVRDLSVSAPGYLTVDQKKMATARRFYQIYLAREGDPWYVEVDGMPVAYSPRPRDLLVVLRDLDAAGYPTEVGKAAQHLLSLPELAGFDLVQVDWRAGLPPHSRHQHEGKQLLLRAPSDLPTLHVPALAALRMDSLVYFAGPVIVHGEAYGQVMAVGTNVHVIPNALCTKNYDLFASLERELGCHYDIQTGNMVFAPNSGTVVVEATKSLVASGLFSIVEMEMFQNVYLFD